MPNRPVIGSIIVAHGLLRPVMVMPILRRRLKSRLLPKPKPPPVAPAYSGQPPMARPEPPSSPKLEVRYATLEVVERLVELEEQVLPVKVLLQRALPVLLSSAGVSTGAMLLYRPEADRLVLVADQGLSEAGVSVLREIAPGGTSGWEIPLHALLNRKAYIIDHIAEHPFVPRLVPVDKLAHVTNLAMAPLYRGSTPAGMILLIADKGRPLEEKHVLSLVLPLSLLAVAIDQERRLGSYASGELQQESPLEPLRPLEISHLVEDGTAKAETEKLQQQAEEALRELTSLREQLVEVQAELEAERRRSAAADGARDRASQSAEALESEIEKLKARAKSAEMERSQLKQRLAALSTEREGLERQLNLAAGQLSESRARLEAMEEELSSRQAAAERALGDLDTAKCELEAAKKKAADIEAKGRAQEEELRQALSQERKENEAKTKALSKAAGELKKYKRAQEWAEERVRKLEREAEKRAEQVASARGEVGELRIQLEREHKKASQQIASLEAALAEKLAEARALSSRLDDERKQREETEQRFEQEMVGREKELEASRAECSKLQDSLSQTAAEKARQLEELEASKDQISKMASRLTQLEAQAREEREALAAERASREEMAARLTQGDGKAESIAVGLRRELELEQARRQELEARLRELESNCASLSKEITDERKEKESVRKAAAQWEKRITELAEAVAKAEKRCRQMQMGLNDAQAAADAYKGQLAEASRQLALKSDESAVEACRVREQLAEQKRRTEQLLGEVESLRVEVKRGAETRRKLEEEISTLGDKLDGERSVIQRLRQAYSESEKLRLRTAEDLSKEESRRHELEEAASAQAARLAALDAEASGARKQMTDLAERCRQLEENRKQYQEEGLHWQAAMSQLNATLSEVRTRLDAKSTEAQRLGQRLDAAERGLREIRALKEEAEKQAAGERSQREALEAKLKKLTSEYETWARERSGWKLEHEQAPVEIRSWSTKIPVHGGPRTSQQSEGGEQDKAAAATHGQGHIALIDAAGMGDESLLNALAQVGVAANRIERSVDDKSRPDLALVNLLAGESNPFKALVFLTRNSPSTPAVAYLRDLESNHGLCLGPTAALDASTPGPEIAETVGSLCRNAKRVLTVSGDVDAMIACKQALTRADYAMSMACDARQGEDLLELVRPDVIIVDSRMPDYGAAHFLESLRTQRPQSAKGLILLLPEPGEKLQIEWARLFEQLPLPDELNPALLAEAAVAAETLKRGFSPSVGSGSVQEIPAAGDRLAG